MNFQQRRFFIRYRDFFMPTGIILVCFLVVLVGIIPAGQRTVSLAEEIQVQQDELTFLKKKLALLESLDETELEQKLQIANSAIPVENSIPSIMQTVETIANEVGIAINSISISGSNELATESAVITSESTQLFGAEKIPFTVNTAGNYDQIKQFLEKSAKVRRFIRVSRFSLSTVSEEESTTQIGFDAFYLPLPKNDPNRVLSDLSNAEINLLTSVENLPNAGDLSNSNQPTGEQIIFDPNRNPFAR